MIPNQLHYEISVNNYNTVRYLIEEDVFIIDDDCLCQVSSVEMLDMLVELGADLLRYPYIILFYAYNDYIELVERAIYYGLDINHSYKGENVFHSTFNCPDIIPKLVKLGADINAVPEGGKTVLSFSIIFFNIDTWTMALLNAGADPSVKDLHYMDSFDYAISMGKEILFGNILEKDIRMGASA